MATQTYCDICDRDDVGTWAGVCADCWRESLAPGGPNANALVLSSADTLIVRADMLGEED